MVWIGLFAALLSARAVELELISPAPYARQPVAAGDSVLVSGRIRDLPSLTGHTLLINGQVVVPVPSGTTPGAWTFSAVLPVFPEGGEADPAAPVPPLYPWNHHLNEDWRLVRPILAELRDLSLPVGRQHVARDMVALLDTRHVDPPVSQRPVFVEPTRWEAGSAEMRFTPMGLEDLADLAAPLVPAGAFSPIDEALLDHLDGADAIATVPRPLPSSWSCERWSDVPPEVQAPYLPAVLAAQAAIAALSPLGIATPGTYQLCLTRMRATPRDVELGEVDLSLWVEGTASGPGLLAAEATLDDLQSTWDVEVAATLRFRPLGLPSIAYFPMPAQTCLGVLTQPGLSSGREYLEFAGGGPQIDVVSRVAPAPEGGDPSLAVSGPPCDWDVASSLTGELADLLGESVAAALEATWRSASGEESQVTAALQEALVPLGLGEGSVSPLLDVGSAFGTARVWAEGDPSLPWGVTLPQRTRAWTRLAAGPVFPTRYEVPYPRTAYPLDVTPEGVDYDLVTSLSTTTLNQVLYAAGATSIWNGALTPTYAELDLCVPSSGGTATSGCTSGSTPRTGTAVFDQTTMRAWLPEVAAVMGPTDRLSLRLQTILPPIVTMPVNPPSLHLHLGQLRLLLERPTSAGSERWLEVRLDVYSPAPIVQVGALDGRLSFLPTTAEVDLTVLGGRWSAPITDTAIVAAFRPLVESVILPKVTESLRLHLLPEWHDLGGDGPAVGISQVETHLQDQTISLFWMLEP